MLTQVEQDIHKKIEREKNIIVGASNLKKKTDNVMVIQKCNTNIREAQQNIEYLQETLKKLQMQQTNDRKYPAENRTSQGYGQLTTIAPEEHRFSRLDVMKYDCPSLSQRIQYMLQQLEFKLQVEEQYQEANDKLTKLYQIDGDQRSSSAAQGGSRESKQRILLLKKALKKYQAINVDPDLLKHAADDLTITQPKFRRKQLTGTLTIGINAIRDVDHIESPLFSRKPETFITIKIDDAIRAKTKPSRNDRWNEEFNIHVGKGNEIEITVYDKINDQMVPVAVMWLMLSDIAEEIRKKKAGQIGQAGWVSNSTIPLAPAENDTYLPTHPAIAEANANGALRQTSDSSYDGPSPSQPITTNSWFVLEPSGQILLTLGFSKSSEPTEKGLSGGLHRHGAIINRKEEIYEQHGHHFVQKSFYNIMCCAYCGDFLRYTGFQCQDCKFLCHKKCYTHVITKCIAKTSTDTNPDEAKLNHRIPHRFEPVSNRGTKWCCHCGYILPWGRKNVRKCTECGVMCHAQCAHLVPDFCGMSMEMANKVLTAIQDTKRSQELRKKSAGVTGGALGTQPIRETHYDSLNSNNRNVPRLEPLQNTPVNTALENLHIAPSNDTPIGGKNYNFTEVSHPQHVSIKPTIPVAERKAEVNNRLNNFIEENSAYQTFTSTAGTNDMSEEEEIHPTLDPSYTNMSFEPDHEDIELIQRMKQNSHDQYLEEEQRVMEPKQHNSPMGNDADHNDVQLNLETRQTPYNLIPSTEKMDIEPIMSTISNEGKSQNPFREMDAGSFEQRQLNEIHGANESSQHQLLSSREEPSYASQQSSPQKSHTSSRHKRRTPRRRKISLDDFVLLKVLGKGNFGKVLLAKSKNNERLCAIKVLKKDHIIKNHDIESARAEKKVFLLATKAKHPFLTNLYCSFQTENRIYFAMEFIGGGDLMWHVQNQRLSVRRAKFYAAEVLLALKYFHDNGVIYRDLKLENILLTPDGHIKIADYGLCKDGMWYGNKTSTFCGTPEFMAPEILKEQEYTKAVDWWAFGVLLYQMLLCQSPFSGDDEDEVFNAILTDEPLYPIDMAGEIVQIFQGLLTKDPERRLGAGPRDALEVMEEPFFKNINFDDILNLRVNPPYVPEIKAADDTSYFEKEFTSAPPTLTPLPSVLSSNLQEEFRGFSFMPDDLLL
ncbi:LAFE_0B09868g1_1 [Lachancea fermentati]|uniref:Protein kinase C-like 1 n=1 Tax=Lachancea fermentati TaxID=4955 RepID=A0A1G4M8P3_LACFM|nr:LAFE_0B09868g1_1 [Lachancea fermentati]